MNFGSNFNNRKLFTGESQSTTRSIDMNRFNNKTGIRSVDEVRMSRMKLKDQLNFNIYGPEKMRQLNNVKNNNIKDNKNTTKNLSTTERQFNHIEAMKNIKRGI